MRYYYYNQNDNILQQRLNERLEDKSDFKLSSRLLTHFHIRFGLFHCVLKSLGKRLFFLIIILLCNISFLS